MDLCASDEVGGDRAGLEDGRKGELVAPNAQRSHLSEGQQRLAAEAVVGVRGDEGGPGDVVRVGEFVEELAGGFGGAASGVQGEEVVAERMAA